MPSAARARPATAAAHNSPTVRCAPLACANDLTPCRMALHFDSASARAPTPSKRPAPTATRGSSYTAPLALRFLYSFNDNADTDYLMPVVQVTADATNKNDENTLPKVTVEADAENTYDPEYYADPYNKDYIIPNASSGTKTDTPIMETPLSLQVISKQVLKDQQVITLDQVLKNVRGVTTNASAGLEGGFFGARVNPLYYVDLNHKLTSAMAFGYNKALLAGKWLTWNRSRYSKALRLSWTSGSI